MRERVSAMVADGRGFWVTCYTDASWSPHGTGWCVWLRSERGRVVRRGTCPAYVTDALESEMAAIFAGVFLAHQEWGDDVRGVFVRTDCQVAIDLLKAKSLRPKLVRRRPGLLRLREKILAHLQEHGIELDLRWVKGHQNTSSTQAYLNRQCDHFARRSRKALEKGRQGVDGQDGGRPRRKGARKVSTGTITKGTTSRGE